MATHEDAEVDVMLKALASQLAQVKALIDAEPDAAHRNALRQRYLRLIESKLKLLEE